MCVVLQLFIFGSFWAVISSQAFVSTEPMVTARRGQPVDIPCRLDAAPDAVFWHLLNGSDKLLVARYFNGEFTANQEGTGYNITRDFSLRLEYPDVEHEGNYSCQANFPDTTDGTNYTFIRIIALADAPTVVKCKPTSTGRCTYTLPDTAAGAGLTVAVTCQVTGVRPLVNITWQNEVGTPLSQTRDFSENGGIYNVTSILQVSESGIGDDFICLAAGEALNGSASVTMYVQAAPAEESGLSSGGIVAIVFCVFIVLIIVAIVVAMYLHHRPKSDPDLPPNEAELQKLQQEITEHTPGALSPLEKREGRQMPLKTRLAAYGVTSAGKSSLVRSFRYAVDGQYLAIEVAQTQAAGGVTLKPKSYEITENVSFVDNRGLRDLDENLVKGTIMKQICGEDDNLTLGDCIDCPILVFDARQPVNALSTFLPAFVDAVRLKYATHPPIIFTHLDDPSVQENLDTIKARVTGMGALDLKLFFVANITEEPSDIKSCFDRRLDFLRILKQLLQAADENMVYRVDQGDNGGTADAADALLTIEEAAPDALKVDGASNSNTKTSLISRARALFKK